MRVVEKLNVEKRVVKDRVIEMAMACKSTAEIRQKVGCAHSSIRRFIHEARAEGMDIPDAPRQEKRDLRPLTDEILDKWASGRFTIFDLADEYSGSAYSVIRSFLDRCRLNGDERAHTNKRHQAMVLEVAARDKADAIERARPPESPGRAREFGIMAGPVIEKTYFSFGGHMRVNRISLSAGISR